MDPLLSLPGLAGEMLLEALLATPCLSGDDVCGSDDFLCLLTWDVTDSVAKVLCCSNPPFFVNAGGECCDLEINFLIHVDASFLATSVGRFFIAFLSILSSIYFLSLQNIGKRTTKFVSYKLQRFARAMTPFLP